MNLRKLKTTDYLIILFVITGLTFCFSLFGYAYGTSEAFKAIGPFVAALFVAYFWVKLTYGKSNS